MQIVLNIISSVFALISLVFFLIAVTGYAREDTTVKNTAWFISENSGDASVYIGLQELIIQESGAGSQVSVYADCNSNVCDACKKQGDNAFGLLVISTIFSFVSLGLSLGGAVVPLVGLSAANLVASFIAFVFGVVGWSLFVDRCFRKISNQIDQRFEFGPGAILSLIAFLLMLLVFAFQVAIVSAQSTPTSPPNQSQQRSSAPVPINEL